MNKKSKCKCGAFALAGLPYCSRCKRIHDLEKELSESKKVTPVIQSLKNQLEICSAQRQQLEEKIKGYEYSNKYPFWVRIKSWEGSMTKEYLQKILDAAKEVPHCFIFEWGRN